MVARVALAVVLGASLLGLAGAAVVVGAGSASASSVGAQIVQYAKSQAGVPYCEGGGGINGPSQPTNGMPPCGAPGYDCMSLAQYAVYQATGITVPGGGPGTSLPGPGTFIPPDGNAPTTEVTNLQPGDVVFFGGTSLDAYAHSGIYAGDSEIWDDLVPGTVVQEHTMGQLDNDYGQEYLGAVRYSGGTTPPPPTTTTTTVAPPPPSFAITTSSLPSGTVSSHAHPVTYSQTLSVTDGTPPYVWSLASGSLPAGLHLTRSGTITGKAKSAGTSSFEVKVVDGKTKAKARPHHKGAGGAGPKIRATGATAERTLSITITPAA